MSLLSYWPTAEEINSCIKHEAEGAHDAVLLAVHRPSPLSYKLISSGERFSANEEELFNYLVTKDVPSGAHVVPITGKSGVGKSHMVRILNARLQSVNEDGRFVVIRIPKSASLRRVVELILEKLPETEYAQVKAEFAKALTEDRNISTAVIRFQGELGIALGHLAKEFESKVRSNPLDKTLKVKWGHAAFLEKFMSDPVLVDHFRENVFPRFVERAIAGQQSINNEALIKDFVPEDLRLPESIEISKSAAQTNAYYFRNLLSKDGEGLREATRLLNEHMVVDRAIRQLFNLHQSLGGMTLQDVIIEIRRRLLREGRELVIFVEDFKALTGIQDILLKVLIQEGVRDGVQELATMRSVIAVTDGYLDTEDTIATRAKREWKVESELTDPADVLKRTKALVASYLNAARWGFKELKRHFETGRANKSSDEYIGVYADPDVNEDSATLAAFGYVDGIPLFPYTELAIEQLAKAALTRNNALLFTPRFIIDDVLRSMLLPGRQAFEKGVFPSPVINGPGVTAEIAQWLESLPISTELRDRTRRVVSIWGNAPRSTAEVGFIPKAVFEAFNLQAPSIEFQTPPKRVPILERPSSGQVQTIQPRPEDDSIKDALEKWIAGERLPQTVANQIRKSIVTALNDRIDWTVERCAKTPLTPTQISIPNAGGEAGLAINSIRVSEEAVDKSGRLRSELVAVTRLYHLKAGNHSYEEGDDDLIWVANLVDRLMPQAIRILRTGTLQRLSVALRYLSTNSLLLGLSLRGKTPSSLAPFLFSEPSIPTTVLPGSNEHFVKWSDLQKRALQVRPELIQMVASYCGSFQGVTGKTAYAIDMNRISIAFQDKTSDVGMDKLGIPAELKESLVSMSETRVTPLARRVQQAALDVRNRLVTDFGNDFDKQEIVDELKALADELGNAGSWPTEDIGMGVAAFKNQCDKFRAVAIRESLSIITNSGSEEDAEQVDSQLLSKIGRLDVNPLIVADGLRETALKVIRAVKKHTTALEAQFKGVDPLATASEIDGLFRAMIATLDTLSAEGESP